MAREGMQGAYLSLYMAKCIAHAMEKICNAANRPQP